MYLLKVHFESAHVVAQERLVSIDAVIIPTLVADFKHAVAHDR